MAPWSLALAQLSWGTAVVRDRPEGFDRDPFWGWSSRAEMPETIPKLVKEVESSFAILVSAGEASTVLALTGLSGLSPRSAPTI